MLKGTFSPSFRVIGCAGGVLVKLILGKKCRIFVFTLYLFFLLHFVRYDERRAQNYSARQKGGIGTIIFSIGQLGGSEWAPKGGVRYCYV